VQLPEVDPLDVEAAQAELALLAQEGGPVDDVVKATGAEPSQVALAWLLQVSDVMLPIPGTKSVDHLEANVAAADLELSDDQMEELTAAAS